MVRTKNPCWRFMTVHASHQRVWMDIWMDLQKKIPSLKQKNTSLPLKLGLRLNAPKNWGNFSWTNSPSIFQGRPVCFRKYIYFFLFPGICKEQRLCGWRSISRLGFLEIQWIFVCHLSIFFVSWLPQKSSLEQTIHFFLVGYDFFWL